MPEQELTFRRATSLDGKSIWSMLRPVFRAGDTYAIDPDISETDAVAYWMSPANVTWLVEDKTPKGSYYLKANNAGGGAHVCNCGFVTAADAQGLGIARKMLEHALDQARTSGFRAMQFNFVVETNARAITIWKRAGFATVGRLPGAFHHPTSGYVDALIMYRDL